jgi:hypothetical protein
MIIDVAFNSAPGLVTAAEKVLLDHLMESGDFREGAHNIKLGEWSDFLGKFVKPRLTNSSTEQSATAQLNDAKRDTMSNLYKLIGNKGLADMNQQDHLVAAHAVFEPLRGPDVKKMAYQDKDISSQTAAELI